MHTEAFQKARLARDRRFDGQFFVAVKSTGIFCRPICPAPLPKEENVEYFYLAQGAMQAGYRPCLRCRPDSAPASCAWAGVNTTVERAMALLRKHPEQSLTMIAQRLGIGERYLRDLFARHLGLSPKQYQLHEQLLFAKQMLHDSAFSIEQIAQSCGFSSARRLQERMRRVMQLTPSQIRKTKHDPKQSLTIDLAYRPPYDWQHVRDFLRLRAIAGMETVNEHSYSRTISLDGCKGWFKAQHNPQKSLFVISLELDNLSHLKTVVAEIRRLLDLDADPVAITASLRAAGIAQEHIRTGIRLPGVWSPLEAGCRAILGQQISVTAAIKLMTKLVQQLGKEKEHMFFFPSAQAIRDSDLSFLGMPDKRRQTLRDFAAHLVDNPARDVESVKAWLDIKGVGPWTVAYATMRGLSEPNVFLGGDLVIKKRLDLLAVEPLKAAPWQSYLTFQLWSMT